ncbi:type VII secretion system-associated protein [Streptomyces sp. NPDC006733]|uniref:type VII secretion system-associated protein n=1 Tax=Streptomyces sp. NPDC006733 TaxID=3155460 RepID=UPI0033D2562B
MAGVTVLDSTFLKQFINDHIDGFVDTLEKIVKDDPTVGPAISSIAKSKPTNTTLASKKPLVIGGLAGENGPAGGGELNKVIQSAAAEIHRILTDQTTLFEDLESALRETIEQLNKSQGKNLQDITADDFIDIFEDVDSDFGSHGGGDESD